ncbi:MAG TPA: hypothetical protein VGM33_01145, partial [Baekduia sp.]
MSSDDRERAHQQLVAHVLRVPSGRWDASSAVEPGSSPLGLLIVDGLLLRDLDFGRRSSTEVLGSGDILRPWDVDSPV